MNENQEGDRDKWKRALNIKSKVCTPHMLSRVEGPLRYFKHHYKNYYLANIFPRIT